jgi:cell wall-associated NlpC family hydrolase
MTTGSRWPTRLVLLALVAHVLSVACASSGAVAPPLPFPSAPAVPSSSPTSDPPSLAPTSLPEADVIVQDALAFQGVRYQLGGEDPAGGFDCSGLVRYVFEQHHVDVPRTVAEQYQQGRHVAVADVQAGDLVFFTTTGPGATHVGIALGAAGPGEFVHAPADGGTVRVEHFDTPYWRSRIVGVRRVF